MSSFSPITHVKGNARQSDAVETFLRSGIQKKEGEFDSFLDGGMIRPFQSGFDFTQVPVRPVLRTGSRIQCCVKDGGACSCPKCTDAKNENNTPARFEQSSDANSAEPETTPAPEISNVPVQTISPQPVETATPDESTQAASAIETPDVASDIGAPTEEIGSAVLVEDSTTELSEGQMKKTEFLQKLRSQICTTIEPVVARVGQTAEDCPYLNYWINFYQEKDAKQIEKTAKKYAPEAATAKTAEEYISLITQRALRAAEIWSTTGRITGVPQGVPTTLPGKESPQRENNTAPETASIQKKAKGGSTRGTDDPRVIQKELGNGQPLASGVRPRMESAFGTNFSHVRTHTDSAATGISERVNARAFTIGNHIAFGNGEYKPGTLLGDALIAHELAHTLQQSDAEPSVDKLETGGSNYNQLEADADQAAAGALGVLWSNPKQRWKGMIQQSLPLLRSGLKIQRCDDKKPKPIPEKPPPAPEKPPVSPTPAPTPAPTPPAPLTLPKVEVGNFRNTGTTSPDNKCGLCPQALGVIADKGINAMELRGDITGHRTGVQYDFKRTREGGAWAKTDAGWTQFYHDGPGENDDLMNEDESLIPKDDKIYVMDHPGFSDMEKLKKLPATETVLKADFVEWVNVKSATEPWTKNSNEFQWHSISWMEKVGGKWRRKAGSSEIEAGSKKVGTDSTP